MLLDIRDKIRGWIAYVIVGLISIPFVLWGVGEYFSGGREDPVATVNGSEITARQFDQAYAVQRQQVIELLGGSASADMLESLNIRKQVLDRMIAEIVLASYAREAGYRAPDQLLANVIESIDAFKENGQFSRSRYETMLRMQGMTVAGFEEQLRRDIATEQLNASILSSAVGIDRAVDQFVRLRDQQREVSLVKLSRAAYAERMEPVSDEQIAAHYEQHADRYLQPERVKVEYLELSPETITVNMDVDELMLEQAYEDYQRRHAEQTRYWASHILVSLPAQPDVEQVEAAREKILYARSRIEAGEAFADVARELSDDPGSRDAGGELGEVKPGMMVQPFEEALFALEEGQLSEPVRTQFGFHLIRLDRKESGVIPPLAEVREELIADLQRREVEGQFYDLAEALANLAYENPDSLVPAAETMGLTIQSTDWFDRLEGTGIARYSQFRKAAFSDEVLVERRNSDLIDLGDSRVVVLRIKDHQASTPLALEAVRDQIAAELAENQLVERMREDAEALAAALAEPDADVMALAEHYGAEVTEPRWFGRQDAELDPALLRTAFALGRPESGQRLTQPVLRPNGDYAVVMVSGVRDGDASTLSEQERQLLQAQIAQDRGLREVDALARLLRDNAKIKLRQDMH